MLGILVQLAISWLIIWLFEKGNLSFLGFYPTKRKLIDFLLFFIITAFCCSIGFFLRMYFGKEEWKFNDSLTAIKALDAIWWNIKSVLFEELSFRGVIFYILIKKLGSTKAIIISSVAFGIYHWFSQEVLGNGHQMIITFLLTGIMGMIYAYGYTKTLSMYVPCAIHLGWNLTQGFIFSHGPIGEGVFILARQPIVNVSYFIYFLILLAPMLSAWIINFLLLKNREENIKNTPQIIVS